MTDRSWIRPMSDIFGRRESRFTSNWSDTLELLGREVEHLQRRDAGTPVLMIDVTEADLRLDGRLRASARPASDAVALAVESTKGPLLFRCDRYLVRTQRYGPAWQHNLRAIALTLEALRAVDRYGATASGEQYTGFRALPTEPHRQNYPGLVSMNQESAVQIITTAAGTTPAAWRMEERAAILRRARRRTHPDSDTGSRAQWDLLELATRYLGLAD